MNVEIDANKAIQALSCQVELLEQKLAEANKATNDRHFICLSIIDFFRTEHAGQHSIDDFIQYCQECNPDIKPEVKEILDRQL